MYAHNIIYIYINVCASIHAVYVCDVKHLRATWSEQRLLEFLEARGEVGTKEVSTAILFNTQSQADKHIRERMVKGAMTYIHIYIYIFAYVYTGVTQKRGYLYVKHVIA